MVRNAMGLRVGSKAAADPARGLRLGARLVSVLARAEARRGGAEAAARVAALEMAAGVLADAAEVQGGARNGVS
ncbi:hypothetical protein SAMN05216200_11418 [Oceanicella actignis]|uniref:Uncharacterized protein n=1 Tax=Oceanicella actignis TaxID=1189325 RepID=A0A1M7U1M5_9RHOB|nr:hypothetical protein SAMN04488119_101404 [Oceanicella actignis]SHN76899.1 hypothetical protein SAMN05216200_11418 [Oceanicella actignis]